MTPVVVTPVVVTPVVGYPWGDTLGGIPLVVGRENVVPKPSTVDPEVNPKRPRY